VATAIEAAASACLGSAAVDIAADPLAGTTLPYAVRTSRFGLAVLVAVMALRDKAKLMVGVNDERPP
jgi:fructose-1,6-bisphosphatase/sedoheptulose 1,7-bisphosphatase-like protein